MIFFRPILKNFSLWATPIVRVTAVSDMDFPNYPPVAAGSYFTQFSRSSCFWGFKFAQLTSCHRLIFDGIYIWHTRVQCYFFIILHFGFVQLFGPCWQKKYFPFYFLFWICPITLLSHTLQKHFLSCIWTNQSMYLINVFR